jgi:hypothetical protein
MVKGIKKLTYPKGKEGLFFTMKETMVIFLKQGKGGGTMSERKTKVLMVKFSLFIVPLIHGVGDKGKGMSGFPCGMGEGAKRRLPKRNRNNLIFGKGSFEGEN